ncbi:MAG: hypothetical protein ACOX7R_01360 [Acetivibrionales bacterium]|jgi:hypothetical protein
MKMHDCRCYYAETGEGKWMVHAVPLPCGKDMHVSFTGGEKPHIGATALAIPRRSLSDPGKVSASVSVLCVTGHKDDQLAREAALKIASALDCVVSVTVGLHIENADCNDIEKITDNFYHAIRKIIDMYR